MSNLYANTIHDKIGFSVMRNERITVPAGTEVRIPAAQVESGRSYYDAKARVNGRLVRLQVREASIIR